MIDQRKLVTRKALMMLSSPAIVRYASLMSVKKTLIVPESTKLVNVEGWAVSDTGVCVYDSLTIEMEIYVDSLTIEMETARIVGEIRKRIWQVMNIPAHLRIASDYVWATATDYTGSSEKFAVKLGA